MLDLEGLTIIGAVLVFAEILGILLALNVVMQPRSSQGTIAWFIALIALPVVTVPFYAIFGRTRFLGYTETLREAAVGVGERVYTWFEQINAMAIAFICGPILDSKTTCMIENDTNVRG